MKVVYVLLLSCVAAVVVAEGSPSGSFSAGYEQAIHDLQKLGVHRGREPSRALPDLKEEVAPDLHAHPENIIGDVNGATVAVKPRAEEAPAAEEEKELADKEAAVKDEEAKVAAEAADLKKREEALERKEDTAKEEEKKVTPEETPKETAAEDTKKAPDVEDGGALAKDEGTPDDATAEKVPENAEDEAVAIEKKKEETEAAEADIKDDTEKTKELTDGDTAEERVLERIEGRDEALKSEAVAKEDEAEQLKKEIEAAKAKSFCATFHGLYDELELAKENIAGRKERHTNAYLCGVMIQLKRDMNAKPAIHHNYCQSVTNTLSRFTHTAEIRRHRKERLTNAYLCGVLNDMSSKINSVGHQDAFCKNVDQLLPKLKERRDTRNAHRAKCKNEYICGLMTGLQDKMLATFSAVERMAILRKEEKAAADAEAAKAAKAAAEASKEKSEATANPEIESLKEEQQKLVALLDRVRETEPSPLDSVAVKAEAEKINDGKIGEIGEELAHQIVETIRHAAASDESDINEADVAMAERVLEKCANGGWDKLTAAAKEKAEAEGLSTQGNGNGDSVKDDSADDKEALDKAIQLKEKELHLMSSQDQSQVSEWLESCHDDNVKESLRAIMRTLSDGKVNDLTEEQVNETKEALRQCADSGKVEGLDDQSLENTVDLLDKNGNGGSEKIRNQAKDEATKEVNRKKEEAAKKDGGEGDGVNRGLNLVHSIDKDSVSEEDTIAEAHKLGLMTKEDMASIAHALSACVEAEVGGLSEDADTATELVKSLQNGLVDMISQANGEKIIATLKDGLAQKEKNIEGLTQDILTLAEEKLLMNCDGGEVAIKAKARDKIAEGDIPDSNGEDGSKGDVGSKESEQEKQQDIKDNEMVADACTPASIWEHEYPDEDPPNSIEMRSSCFGVVMNLCELVLDESNEKVSWEFFYRGCMSVTCTKRGGKTRMVISRKKNSDDQCKNLPSFPTCPGNSEGSKECAELKSLMGSRSAKVMWESMMCRAHENTRNGHSTAQIHKCSKIHHHLTKGGEKMTYNDLMVPCKNCKDHNGKAKLEAVDMLEEQGENAMVFEADRTLRGSW